MALACLALQMLQNPHAREGRWPHPQGTRALLQGSIRLWLQAHGHCFGPASGDKLNLFFDWLAVIVLAVVGLPELGFLLDAHKCWRVRLLVRLAVIVCIRALWLVG